MAEMNYEMNDENGMFFFKDEKHVLLKHVYINFH